MEDYSQIVNDWYASLRNTFVNFIHSRFSNLDFDEIQDIYNDTFMAIYNNLQQGRVKSDTKWKSYIFQIGINMALSKSKENGKLVRPNERNNDDDVDSQERFETGITFNTLISEDDMAEKKQLINDILLREIASLPEPCETILKDFYFGGFSMSEIKDEIHYQTNDSVKAMKNRCMNRLRNRIKTTFMFLDITV